MMTMINAVEAGCSDELTHEDICRLACRLLKAGLRGLAVLDLDGVSAVTTAAFARLIGLRRELRSAGGDLHLAHINRQAKARYEIYALGTVLPEEP